MNNIHLVYRTSIIKMYLAIAAFAVVFLLIFNLALIVSSSFSLKFLNVYVFSMAILLSCGWLSWRACKLLFNPVFFSVDKFGQYHWHPLFFEETGQFPIGYKIAIENKKIVIRDKTDKTLKIINMPKGAYIS